MAARHFDKTGRGVRQFGQSRYAAETWPRTCGSGAPRKPILDHPSGYSRTYCPGQDDQASVPFLPIGANVDASGPRDGQNRSCRIDTRLRPSGSILIEQAGADMYGAIDEACDRVGRAVARELERERDTRPDGPRSQGRRM